MASLAGKAFTVTGAASGIGLATAKILAARGASLFIGDINEAAMEKAAAIISNSGRVEKAVLDVRDRSAVRSFMQKCQSRFGRIDGCANVAGVSGKRMNIDHIWELDAAEYDFVMNVNTRGVFNCLAEQLTPGMLPEDASIVNISSICGLRGLPKGAVYCASKHAVVGLTRTAAIEAGPRRIRVNSVAPGMVDTPMLSQNLEGGREPAPQTTFAPIARFANPEEIGHVVAFLLSNESSFVTGATYSVDGGWNT
ncbi:hypothetical protein N7451_003093 [Penicillium sp. IBT 35674x]|nr:hypothetical protein N7451_003093 [Penicillium sp. IBT 35674x]